MIPLTVPFDLGGLILLRYRIANLKSRIHRIRHLVSGIGDGVGQASSMDMAAMTSRMMQIVTDVCNELPFVKWDRFIDCHSAVVVFGWIDREEDSYKDFVSVEVSYRGYVEFTTSSAKYSETISNIYVSHGRLPSGTHQPCQRIEDNSRLAGVKNVVRIRDS